MRPLGAAPLIAAGRGAGAAGHWVDGNLHSDRGDILLLLIRYITDRSIIKYDIQIKKRLFDTIYIGLKDLFQF
jgi:hypothetical protein